MRILQKEFALLVHIMIGGFILILLVLPAICWLGWQLLRQNGRLLLRLDELEKRLDELEFGAADEPEGLPLGTEAPAFELPDLSGGRQSLAQFRGQPVLLVFFNPECGFCRELMPKLAELSADVRSHRGNELDSANPESEVRLLTSTATAELPLPLLISTGDAEKNQKYFAEHKVGGPVLLQQDGEIAKAYQAHGTPTGYLISADGKIASQLAIGAEALLKLAASKSEFRIQESEQSQSRLTSAATNGNGNGHATRFGNRSLANSKIKRDGLKAGTSAPDFRLPRLDGKGELSLCELRGKRVLLVFSSPGCGPCNALAPQLEKFYRGQRPLTPSLSPDGGEGVRRTGEGELPLTVVLISRGEPKENRAKVKEHGLTFPVVLQQQWEISRRFAIFATPVAYLIDEAGVIAHDVAVGTDQIQALLSAAANGAISNGKANFALNLVVNT